MKPEQWRPIAGYEELYEVSTYGNVRNSRTKELRSIQQTTTIPIVTLNKKGVRETVTIASLVASTFVAPAAQGSRVGHLDGDTTNNHVMNLVWQSRRTAQKGSAAKAKLTQSQVLKIFHEFIKDGNSCETIALRYKVTPSTIRGIVTGRTWKHIERPIWFQPLAAEASRTPPQLVLSNVPRPENKIPPSVLLDFIQRTGAGKSVETILPDYPMYFFDDEFLAPFRTPVESSPDERK